MASFEIYINGGFLNIVESSATIIKNPRAETSYSRPSTTSFEFKFKESTAAGQPIEYPLLNGHAPFEYADLANVFEDNILITKPADAEALALFLDKKIGFFSNPLDYHVELAKGNIPGEEPLKLDIVSTQIGNSAFLDIWGESTNLVYEAAATTWEVLSSEAADAVAGTGASKVQITTLDGNFDLQTQDVTLTGVTPVALTGTHLRPHLMKVVAPVGTDLANKGELTLRAVASGNTQDSIIALRGKSFSTHFTVPAGREALLERGSILVGKGDDVVIQLVTFADGANEPHLVQSFARVYQSGQELIQITPVPIPEKVSIRLQALSSNSGVDVTISLDFIITDL